MSEKRKDAKGRILKDGESYRSDGRYMYRYPDIHGHRQYVYAKNLAALREKEKQIRQDLNDGVDYSGGEITVKELCEQFVKGKANVRKSTLKNYNRIIRIICRYDISQQKIKSVKQSDIKSFLIELSQEYSYSSVSVCKNILQSIFEVAVKDDILRKNPLHFRLNDFINNDTVGRRALSKDEKERFLAGLKSDRFGKEIYDEVVILLKTGLRISELYGLTKEDVDCENHTIDINKQLVYDSNYGYYLEKPKSKSGERMIPLLDNDAILAFNHVLKNRKQPTQNIVVDGYSNFIFICKSGNPKSSKNLEASLRNFKRRYDSSHSKPLPNITPHVLRHTFCTDMINSGMDIKSLQYLMGHSNADVTMNVYAHSNYKTAAAAYQKAIDLLNSSDTKTDANCDETYEDL